MSEKKIDLSNVQIGNPLWTVFTGDTVCEKFERNRITACGFNFGTDGTFFRDDKFPTCFHSREEFLDFHDIAPVRMTKKELEDEASKIVRRQGIGFDTDLQIGFLLAGGQIIEEPKHLPCMLCGANVEQKENGIVYHNDNGCILSDHNYSGTYWDDPSKRGGKIG